MRMLGRGFLIVAILARAVAAQPEAGDLRKSKAYLREVKKHLLESYIDSDRVKEEDLIVAGLKAMAGAMEGRALEKLGKDVRAAVTDGMLGQASLEDARARAERAAPAPDLLALSDQAPRATVPAT